MVLERNVIDNRYRSLVVVVVVWYIHKGHENILTLILVIVVKFSHYTKHRGIIHLNPLMRMERRLCLKNHIFLSV